MKEGGSLIENHNTTLNDILNSFHSLPMSKYILNPDLQKQWFLDSLGEYELEIEDLFYDDVLEVFSSKLPQYVIKTISLIMYTNYLTRELSRAEKLNGISGKDIQLTGTDGSKRVTLADLELEISRAEKMLHKQKQHCFN